MRLVWSLCVTAGAGLMPKQTWSAEDKERALLALHDGATYGEVHADTGIPKGTLASWRRRQDEDDRRRMVEELDTPAERAEAAAARRERTRAARETLVEVRAEDRSQLAARLHEEVHTLLDRINAPTIYHHVKVVNQGEKMGSTTEIVDVETPTPNASDTKALVVSAAVLIDKLQLLTGQATERTEQVGGEIDLEQELRLLGEAAARGELRSQEETGSAG